MYFKNSFNFWSWFWTFSDKDPFTRKIVLPKFCFFLHMCAVFSLHGVLLRLHYSDLLIQFQCYSKFLCKQLWPNLFKKRRLTYLKQTLIPITKNSIEFAMFGWMYRGNEKHDKYIYVKTFKPEMWNENRRQTLS